MTNKPEFSSMGKQITMRVDLSEFSSRDRVNLMRQLMEDFGLLYAMTSDRACLPAVKLLDECIKNNW